MFAKELTIFTDKVYRDKYEAIEEIAHLPNEFVNNNDEYAKAVIDRENVIATYIGYGIAIPHAISAAVNQAFVIYVKFLNGCPWTNEGKIIAVEPTSSPVLSGGESGPHKIQGIGAGFVPNTYNNKYVDEIFQVENDQAILAGRQLAQQEGLDRKSVV